jgi:hypothetical protein
VKTAAEVVDISLGRPNGTFETMGQRRSIRKSLVSRFLMKPEKPLQKNLFSHGMTPVQV